MVTKADWAGWAGWQELIESSDSNRNIIRQTRTALKGRCWAFSRAKQKGVYLEITQHRPFRAVGLYAGIAATVFVVMRVLLSLD